MDQIISDCAEQQEGGTPGDVTEPATGAALYGWPGRALPGSTSEPSPEGVTCATVWGTQNSRQREECSRQRGEHSKQGAALWAEGKLGAPAVSEEQKQAQCSWLVPVHHRGPHALSSRVRTGYSFLVISGLPFHSTTGCPHLSATHDSVPALRV